MLTNQNTTGMRESLLYGCFVVCWWKHNSRQLHFELYWWDSIDSHFPATPKNKKPSSGCAGWCVREDHSQGCDIIRCSRPTQLRLLSEPLWIWSGEIQTRWQESPKFCSKPKWCMFPRLMNHNRAIICMCHMSLFGKMECEDSCAMIALATDQLADDLRKQDEPSSTPTT